MRVGTAVLALARKAATNSGSEHSARTAGVYAQSGVRAKKLCRKICHKQSRVRTFDKYNGTYNKNKKAT